MSVKVLVLAESLRINETSSGIVSSTLTQALALGGHEITCIYPERFSYPVSWLSGVELVPFRYPSPDKTWIEKIPKIRALPVYLTGHSLNDRAKIDKWVEVTSNVLSNKQFDCIVVLGSGSEFLPHFAIEKMDISTPIILNFHDPFPWHCYPEPYKKPATIYSRIHQKKIQKAIDKAFLVCFPSELLKQHMSRFYLRMEQKSLVLPHVGIQLDGLPAKESDDLVSLPENKFNLVHIGSLLGPRNPNALLQAFARFIQEDERRRKSCVLSIIGNIAREHNKIVREHRENVRILNTRVSYKRSLKLMNAADVLILMEAVASFSPFLPGKFSDYVMAGKPVLALTPRNSEVMRLLGSDYPYWATVDDEERIYISLCNLWDHWRSDKLFNSVPPEVREYISPENVNEMFTKALEACTSTSSSPTA